MADRDVDALVAALDPLLRALDALGFIARNCHPPLLAELTKGVGPLADNLAAARETLAGFPERFAGIAEQMRLASDDAIAGLNALRDIDDPNDGIRRAYGALRKLPAALNAIYPLAGILPPVNRFFLEPEMRGDLEFQKRLMGVAAENTGVMPFTDEDNRRAGFWLYVPETYDGTPLPLVMALHGGSGSGRSFLWSWVHAGRSRGAIVVAPSSLAETWAIQGEDVDSPNLSRILEFVRSEWNVDESRMLLTGMSDGGTFSYVSGLDARSPFTHLAPVSAGFHPMFVEMADEGRLQRTPIHIVHGTLDWMFPAAMAKGSQRALSAAGARVTYQEIDDLSHCYPREMNGPLLQWMAETPAG